MTRRTLETPSRPEFRLLVASERPAVQVFFTSLRKHVPGLALRTIGTSIEELEAELGRGPDPAVTLVDAAVEPIAGIAFCRQLRSHRPHVPITALLCCPQAADPWQLQTLFASGVSSVLDLQASPAEAARVLTAAAKGAAVLHLHLRRAHRGLLRDLFVERGPRTGTKLQVLELVCRGLPDHEIGRRLHLSPHTVKHHIESLRAEVGVRNRIELAAWAGRHGFYVRDDDRTPETVPVMIARPSS